MTYRTGIGMFLGVDEFERLWGSNIKTGRKTLGLTQASLALLVGVQQATVARWEAGDRTPSDRDKIRIATALRQDVRLLFPLTRSVAS